MPKILNSGIILKTFIHLGAHTSLLNEPVLLSNHNICFG